MMSIHNKDDKYTYGGGGGGGGDCGCDACGGISWGGVGGGGRHFTERGGGGCVAVTAQPEPRLAVSAAATQST